jgi:hypothetical protein
LETLESTPESDAMWSTLAKKATEDGNLIVAARYVICAHSGTESYLKLHIVLIVTDDVDRMPHWATYPRLNTSRKLLMLRALQKKRYPRTV